jgi:type II restriction/modification system DNA methylase subunit YeeA
MATGEPFGPEDILKFNGGLFDDTAVIELTKPEINELIRCAECNWAQVEPSIFGTLFERILDPNKRSQLGAHYTSRADIETLLKPVMLDPLRREWDAVRADADKLYEKLQATVRGTGKGTAKQARAKFDKCVLGFLDRLLHVTVLDPACGSGNFLYVALRMLLDLEKEVWLYANTHGITHIPHVNPSQLRGIELNPHAQELAQVVIWIGYLQWMKDSGIRGPDVPVLDTMENIERRDAILDLTDPDKPKEPDWPDAEFIVGNPPFLGTKKLRSGLGDDYVLKLFKLYGDRIPNFSDLCCYWFEKARAMIAAGKTKRAGLLATQGIRGGDNRVALKRINETGSIFFAVSDRDWVLDGANVHISMVGFDDGTEKTRILDDKPVAQINPNLSASSDITKARKLAENRAVGFIADVKAGQFDIPLHEATALLDSPNAHGRPNSDVLRPWMNGLDITRRPRDFWIIDFGADLPLDQAILYEKPIQIVRERVKPARDLVKRAAYRECWWLHAEPCAVMRKRIEPLARFLATITVSKHRLFTWVSPATLPDHQLVAFAREDEYAFGVLHSRVHELWALRMGTRLETRPRYTPTTCFETFPFPEPTDAQREAIAAAAKELETLRSNWLNPPEWTRTEVLEFPGSADGPWKRYVTDVDPKRGIGTVHYPRLVAREPGYAEKLKKRTLTNLYNESPAWLKAAHAKLDAAVFAAYGWPADISDDDLLARLLVLNLSRAAATGPSRTETDDAE